MRSSRFRRPAISRTSGVTTLRRSRAETGHNQRAVDGPPSAEQVGARCSRPQPPGRRSGFETGREWSRFASKSRTPRRPKARARPLEALRLVVDLVRPGTQRGAVESEWESRAVLGVVEVVEAWLRDDGAGSATLSIGDRCTRWDDAAHGGPMIGLAPDRRKTLDVQRISVAGRGRVTASAFLETLRRVAEAFEFGSVAAVRCDGEAGEVGESAFSDAQADVRTANRSRASPCSQGRGRPSSSFSSQLEMSPPRSPSR